MLQVVVVDMGPLVRAVVEVTTARVALPKTGEWVDLGEVPEEAHGRMVGLLLQVEAVVATTAVVAVVALTVTPHLSLRFFTAALAVAPVWTHATRLFLGETAEALS